MNSIVLTSIFLPQLSSSHTNSLPSLNLLCHSEADARFMQDGQKAVWSIPYVSVQFFPSLKQNIIAYPSSKVSSRPDCIFEIHQLWQSGFSRVHSNSCCSCSFELEIIKIGQSSYKIYSNNILNFQESTTILNACTRKSGTLLNAPRIWLFYAYIFLQTALFFNSLHLCWIIFNSYNHQTNCWQYKKWIRSYPSQQSSFIHIFQFHDTQ